MPVLERTVVSRIPGGLSRLSRCAERPRSAESTSASQFHVELRAVVGACAERGGRSLRAGPRHRYAPAPGLWAASGVAGGEWVAFDAVRAAANASADVAQ